MYRILVVEDEDDIQKILENYLIDQGYAVTLAYDGVDGIAKFHNGEFDLVLLDVMMPKIDGFGVCELIRRESNVPIIMLTALDEEAYQIKGFDMNADDYVTKPLELRELVVRVKNLLWRIDHARQAQPETKDNCYQFAGYCLNVSRHTLELGDETIKLTRAEYEMLVAFVTNPGEILSRERLLRMLSARRVDNPDLRTVDVLIRRLRHKLRADLLVTQHGEGYFLAADVY